MQNSRLRLVQMAGPAASFTWWGQVGEPDAFLTAYAYYADWHASKALDLSLPPEHWQRSEERRVGNAWVSTCKSRWPPYPEKTKHESHNQSHHTQQKP